MLVVPNAVDELLHAGDDICGAVDLDPEHLGDLTDQDVESEPADESDEDRLGQEVREEAEPEHRAQREDDAADDGLGERELDVVGAPGHGETAERGGDQGGSGGIR